MSEERRNLIRRIALTLAWLSTLYGCVLILDASPANDTAGWIFFGVPIALVVGERITRGDEQAERDAASDGDETSESPRPGARSS